MNKNHLFGLNDQDNTLYGDGALQVSSGQGGKEWIVGGDKTLNDGQFMGNLLVGDWSEMSGTAYGGRDVLQGGANLSSDPYRPLTNTLIGDAGLMTDSSHGGNDKLTGGANNGDGSVSNVLYGDVGSIYPWLFGYMSGHAVGGDDVLKGGDATQGSTQNSLLGDAPFMTEFARGGNDVLIGGSVVGCGAATVNNALNGDGHYLYDAVQAGNDTLIGGNANENPDSHVFNDLNGDGYQLSGSSHAGNDQLCGGNSYGGQVVNTMRGDAFSPPEVLGNDTLVGGSCLGRSSSATVTNYMTGDGDLPVVSASGGSDVLTGGNAMRAGTVINIMHGDYIWGGTTAGNNDVLIAGRAAGAGHVSNDLWGDAGIQTVIGGSDTFVFRDRGKGTVGQDNVIEDFRQSDHDHISLEGISGVHSFQDLAISYDPLSNYGEAIIHAGADVITLHNFLGTLSVSDFIIA